MENQTNQLNQKQNQQNRVEKTIDQMTYFDDEFFNACMQNNPDAALLIIRVVLRKPDLVFVNKPEIQKTINNFGHKSIKMDLFCASENKYMAVEMQQADQGADPRRARYYSSLIDANTSVAGEDYKSLPDIYVIFITRNDVRRYGKPYYDYRNVDRLTGDELGDGSHILYVNGEYKGDDDFGRLMHDLRCANPHEMYNDELKKPALFLKETAEGRTSMGDAVKKLLDETTKEVTEEVTKQVTKQNKEDTAKKMMAKGYRDEEISDITGLSIKEVQNLQSKMK